MGVLAEARDGYESGTAVERKRRKLPRTRLEHQAAHSELQRALL